MSDMIDRVQHVKRGSTYRVIGCGKVQTDTPLADYAEVVIYQGENDGMIWCRPVAEFDDGRFAALPPSQPDAVSKLQKVHIAPDAPAWKGNDAFCASLRNVPENAFKHAPVPDALEGDA